MKSSIALKHRFVEFLPDVLDERTLYVSMEYATVSHKCACGCGREVVTPLSPTDWKLTFDGRAVSLEPSVGNWGFDCRSHYWIVSGQVVWAGQWSKDKVTAGRDHDAKAKRTVYLAHKVPPTQLPVVAVTAKPSERPTHRRWWRPTDWFRRR